MTTRRRLTATAALGAAALSAFALHPLQGASADGGSRAGSADPLAAVRAATARYHRVDAAVADGYLPSEECAASPDGVMGHHYVKPSLMGVLDPQRPPILLYVPGEGGLRLAGVEWFQVDADQDLTTTGDRPSLLGRPFDGPMEGHEPEMAAHYDLHAWVWANNPAGVFAPWNPSLGC